MTTCFFVSDLHGQTQAYQCLIDAIRQEEPEAVFIGGDLTPSGVVTLDQKRIPIRDFIPEYLFPAFETLKLSMDSAYPRIFMILGNDDSKAAEAELIIGEKAGLWEYVHGRRIDFEMFSVYGYAYVPPTPFQLKDWERYDVSRHLEPGCIAPEDGWHSTPPNHNEILYASIQNDLEKLTAGADLANAIFLFHSPPYQTHLDRAALDGRVIDHVPLDVHVGSIAIRRLIEKRQPLLTLHGHIHESALLTGKWAQKLGSTWMFSAAHGGPELALVRFDPHQLETATRELIR